MKKILVGFAALVAVCVTVWAAGGSTVSPATLTLVNLRGENTLNVVGIFTPGDSLVLTNCVTYTGSTTSTPIQTLTNVVVTFTVGYPGSVATYTGTVQNAATGLWCHPGFTVPTNGAVNIEVKLTDENLNRYTYGWKLLSTQDPLQ